MNIPARHPERPLRVPGAVRMFALMMGIRNPNPRQWRRLGERLTVGDEPRSSPLRWARSEWESCLRQANSTPLRT
jgi:hypothetical protein